MIHPRCKPQCSHISRRESPDQSRTWSMAVSPQHPSLGTGVNQNIATLQRERPPRELNKVSAPPRPPQFNIGKVMSSSFLFAWPPPACIPRASISKMGRQGGLAATLGCCTMLVNTGRENAFCKGRLTNLISPVMLLTLVILTVFQNMRVPRDR